MAEDEKGTSSWYKVPTWSGNPSEWRAFRKEMNWWIASLDVEASRKYNVAARWALRQYGVVRARCEEFEPDDLLGIKEEKIKDPDSGEEVILVEADPFAGLRKLMKALEESVGKTQLDRKGELRAQFYQELRRNAGERISAYCSRFRTLAAELKREGIDLPPGELGWFLKDRMGLDPIRKQLLDTALGGSENYEQVESEALRLFRELHTSDPLYRRPAEQRPLLQRFMGSQHGGSSSGARTSWPSSGSSQASTFRSFRSSSSAAGSMKSSQPPRKPFQRQAMVSEFGEADEEELVPADDDGGQAMSVPSIEEVLQMEAEVLAAEIKELEEDETVDPQFIDELESGVEAAAESLVTMREARSRIAEVRRDRGYGKANSGKGGGSVKPKMHGNQSQAKKQSSTCWDCGEQGHWAGDGQCTRPGAGLFRPKGKGSNTNTVKQVKIAETLNTEHSVDMMESEPADIVSHEVLVCRSMPRSLTEALDFAAEVNVTQDAVLATDKRMVGALDSACNRTCSGECWLKHYLDSLKHAPPEIQALVKSVPESEVFRFGNGGCKTSYIRYRLPMMIDGSLLTVWVSVVQIPTLGLLLGRDFLDAIGAVLSFSRKMLRADLLDGSLVKLKQLMAGHFALPLAPRVWQLPGALRWRRVGQDGVVEVQVSSRDWLRRKLDAHSSLPKSEHEHLVTEQGVKAADVSHSGLKLISNDMIVRQHLAHPAQDMTRPVKASVSTTTSSPTRSFAERDLRDASRSIVTESNAVAKDDVAAHRPRKVARSWNALMVAAAALSSVLAGTVSQCHHPRAVEASMRSNGRQPKLVFSVDQEGPRSQAIHCEQSGGARRISEPTGPPLDFLGGPIASRDDGSSPDKRGSFVSSKSSCGRSSRASSTSRERGQESRGTSHSHWTKGWPPDFEGRSAAFGISLTPESQRRHESGRSEEHVQAHCQRPQAGSIKFQDHKRKQQLSIGCRSSGKGCTSDPASVQAGPKQSPAGGSTGPHARRSRDVDAARSKVSDHDAPGHAACHGDPIPASASAFSNEPRGVGSRHGTRSSSREHDGSLRRLGLHVVRGAQTESRAHGQLELNPWKVIQDVKPGLSQQIAQAWERHERDRRLVSRSAGQIRSAMQTEFENDMEKHLNETFVTAINLPDSHGQADGPLMQEIFTASQRVTKEAQRRGHLAGDPLSLETGWDFRRALDRKAAIAKVKREQPFFLVIAYPCGPWSPLMRLRAPANLDAIREEHRILIRFALTLAKIQLKGKRHFILENPIGSASWSLPEVIKFLGRGRGIVGEI